VTDRRSEFHRSAQAELNNAIQYYETRVPGLGAEFLVEVRGAVSRVCEFPELGPLMWGTRRRVLIRRFPYGLVYRILESGAIRVLAVMHLRQRPNYWRGRR
jgi:plasmid stabilization system protein ParE